jgi:hypothetical protein
MILWAGAAFAHTSLDLPDGGELYHPGDEVLIQWHISIGHNLQNWDLWYATDAPDLYTSCTNQSGPTWIPLAMDIAPECTNGGGGCGVPGGCTMQYTWTVPDGIDSDAVKIRVRMDNVNADYYDVSNAPFTITPSTAVDSPAAAALRFEGNHPNPFNPKTEIRFSLPGAGRAVVSVYDIAGNRVAVLMDENRQAGSQSVIWEGKDDAGHALPSGIYFARVESSGEAVTGKLTLLK